MFFSKLGKLQNT